LSVSELSTQTNLRLPKIKAGILAKKTRTQIGDDCGVSERTIRRDITDWTKTDDFLRWAREVWIDYLSKVDDVEVFRQATKIIIKTIPTQAEIKEEYTEKVLHVMVSAKLMKDEPTNPKTSDKLRAT